jgi:hypothetical protein
MFLSQIALQQPHVSLVGFPSHLAATEYTLPAGNLALIARYAQ